ncbi:MAG: DUF1648 domain-containing protein [Butyrivibrio sp.]|nr:DUF1648 domain-containing protein [Butyrivibrio sp.]
MTIRQILNIATTVICAAVLLALTVYLAVQWQQIPAQVASNYGADGSIVNYESKVSLIFQTGFAWFIFVLLTWMSMRPVEKGGTLRFTRMRALRIGRRDGDFVERARKRDPHAANNVGIDMLMCLKLAITVLFSGLIVASVRNMPLAAWMLPVMLAFVFVPVVIHLFRLWRIASG